MDLIYNQALTDIQLQRKLLIFLLTINQYTKQQWTCYSSSYKSFYTERFKPLWIDKLEDELLFIPTSQVNKFGPNMSDEVRQQSQYITPTLQIQSNIAKVTESQINQQTGRQISIDILIQDGTYQRELKLQINENELLDQVAEAVMNYLGLEREYASVDLFQQNNIPLNSCKKRTSTLKELFAGLDAIEIKARVRWIGR